jgi:hypothetical protein
VGFLESYVRNLGAVAGVPAKCRTAKPLRVVDEEQNELERVRETDEVELRCRRQGHGRVVRVESAAEAGVG